MKWISAWRPLVINSIVRLPKLLLPKRHIILISHMRANTTLLGHIFGSHPDISGYYEHHIGYYSWKSLIRERAKFSYENPDEPITKIYFDKVLHNDHHINDKVYKLDQVSLLFMLRRPEKTIKSIVALYQKNEPNHEFCSSKNATNYYIDRLNDILNTALNYAKYKDLYYVDAESIVTNSDITLSEVSKWYDLHPDLEPKYNVFELSGKAKYGDSSNKIKQGYISKTKNNYSNIEVDETSLEHAEDVYERTKKGILEVAKSYVVS